MTSILENLYKIYRKFKNLYRIQKKILQNFCDMKIARAPEEDIRYPHTPNWAILYHEGKELSPLRMASKASCLQQKD